MHDSCHWVTVANIKQFRRFSIMDTNYRGVSTVLFQLLNHYINCKAYQYTHYEIEIESVPQHEIKNDSDMYWSLGYAILSYVKFNAHETEISSSEFDLADIIKFIENLDEHPSIEKFPVRPTTTSEKDRCPSLLHLIQLRCVCRSPTIADTSEFYICKKDRCYMRVHTSCMEDHDRLNHLQISRLQKYTNLDEDLNDLTSDKNIESTEPIEELQQPRPTDNFFFDEHQSSPQVITTSLIFDMAKTCGEKRIKVADYNSSPDKNFFKKKPKLMKKKEDYTVKNQSKNTIEIVRSSTPPFIENREYHRGLFNMGGTCHVNACIQVLASTKFAPLLRPTNEVDVLLQLDWCFQCELGCLMNDVPSPGAAIQPDAFISRLRYVDSKYVVGVQQDAEEFMAQAFVTMASSTVTCQLCHSLYDEIARKSQVIFHWPSIVMHAFGCKLVEQRHCRQCGDDTQNSEEQCILRVPLINASLVECLKEYFLSEEKILNNCHKVCGATYKYRRTFMNNPPKNLLIQLKRFRSDDTKICMITEYPETLDIGPFIVPEDQSHSSSRYTLYGMVVHQGLSIDSGHYYTYVKSNKAWKLINDENVTDMNMSDVLKADKLPNDSTSMAYSNAYILCYEQQTDENFEMDCTTGYTSATKDQKKETGSLNNENVTDNQKNEKLFSNSRASIENDMVNNIFERPTKHSFDEEESNSGGEFTQKTILCMMNYADSKKQNKWERQLI
ncbi:unnamed protein product [Didymodactylos carnosus]|uniref:Ubiquitin carboxyl-terminal hydrolase 36 n=1 Tax=Didymodactylos carnosus TaxID=1234261 RepID=A0A8S2TSU1_9BILA|nr:unnamed protein product [Didymodactylos carnosus]